MATLPVHHGVELQTKELVELACDGDAASRRSLYERELDGVRAVCFRRLRSSHDVDDAVQETFVRAFSQLESLRDPERLGPWLRSIAANVCTDIARHGQRVIVTEPEDEADVHATSPDEHVVDLERARQLHDRLSQLGERDRRALWLRDAVGLPVPEIASRFGLTDGSARVLLARARKRLRATYANVLAPLWLLREHVRQRLDWFGLSGGAVPASGAALVAVVAYTLGGGTVAVPTPAVGTPVIDQAPEAATDRLDARTVDTEQHTGTTPSTDLATADAEVSTVAPDPEPAEPRIQVGGERPADAEGTSTRVGAGQSNQSTSAEIGTGDWELAAEVAEVVDDVPAGGIVDHGSTDRSGPLVSLHVGGISTTVDAGS